MLTIYSNGLPSLWLTPTSWISSLLLMICHVELLLLGGSNRCRGLLIQRPLNDPSQRFGVSCDLDAGDNEAKVICRHIGCNPNGARRSPDPRV